MTGSTSNPDSTFLWCRLYIPPENFKRITESWANVRPNDPKLRYKTTRLNATVTWNSVFFIVDVYICFRLGGKRNLPPSALLRHDSYLNEHDQHQEPPTELTPSEEEGAGEDEKRHLGSIKAHYGRYKRSLPRSKREIDFYDENLNDEYPEPVYQNQQRAAEYEELVHAIESMFPGYSKRFLGKSVLYHFFANQWQIGMHGWITIRRLLRKCILWKTSRWCFLDLSYL